MLLFYLSLIDDEENQNKFKMIYEEYSNLSRDIYPLVANTHCCKKSSIERNLRTLLLNMNMTDLQNFTNTDIPDKITVSQLIDILVVYFLQQQQKFR